MQNSQEHLKTMVYAEFGGQTECIMGNWKIENGFTGQTEISRATSFKSLDSSLSFFLFMVCRIGS